MTCSPATETVPRPGLTLHRMAFGSDKVVEAAIAGSDTLDFSAAGPSAGAAREGITISLFGTWGQAVLPASGAVAAGRW